MEIVLADSLDALPPAGAALFPRDPLANLAWFRTVAAHAMPDGVTPCYATVLQGGIPCAVVPLQRDAGGVRGLTSPYTCLSWPLLPASADPAMVQAAGSRLGRFCRGFPVVRFDAIPAEWPGLRAFMAGLRQAGLQVQIFDHFGNWYEPVRGRGWQAYLADRQGALRETVRRKLRRCEQQAQFELVASHDLERGIDAFEAVYRASWKDPEPFPRFNAALMRAAAAAGALRLGMVWSGDQPAAAQFWVAADGHATVLKLAHDERFKALSPGTALTAWMIRRLLDEERMDELDFGRGDDPYKALWATQRRQRLGLLAINPWRPAGLLTIARAAAAGVRRRLRRS